MCFSQHQAPKQAVHSMRICRPSLSVEHIDILLKQQQHCAYPNQNMKHGKLQQGTIYHDTILLWLVDHGHILAYPDHIRQGIQSTSILHPIDASKSYPTGQPEHINSAFSNHKPQLHGSFGGDDRHMDTDAS
jgi:BarA-like signal transduction histidine kinase